MAKRHALVTALFLLAAIAASAGDVAQFINLGFSADSKYFMFGQYGIAQKTSAPWADTFIVDVQPNAFVKNGTRQFRATRAVDPGATALGALFNALSDGSAEIRQAKVDHLNTGRLLYILVDGAAPPDTIEFRDFQAGRSYKVILNQSSSTAATSVTSTYSITVAITEKDGKVRTLAVGDPTFKRAGVKAYHIKQIVLAPDGASLVFVVQKQQQDTDGDNIRYMVETLKVK
jgi:predicted secreted protein